MTSYEKIFRSFLHNIREYTFLHLDQETLEEDLVALLNGAIIDFQYPNIDLREKDDFQQTFAEDLTLDEIDLLGNLMVVRWLKPKILDTELIERRMSPAEFKSYSQANHIDILRKLYLDCKYEVDSAEIRYSLRKNNKNRYDELG